MYPPHESTASRRDPWSAHVLTGFGAGVLATVAEALVCGFASRTQTVDPGSFALAVATLGGLYLMVGTVAGALVGGAGAILGRSFVGDAVTRLVGARAMWSRRPDAVAVLVAVLGALAVVAAGSFLSSRHFATRYHDATLAAAANAMVIVATMVAAVGVAGVLQVAVRPLARRVGRVATVGGVLVLAAGLVVVVVVALVLTFPALLTAYAPVRLAWVPALVGLYGLAAVSRLLWVRPLGRGRRMHGAAAASVLVSLIAFTTVAVTYGSRSSVRHVVEDRSAGGRTLIRGFASLSDWDRDGHAFVFGGGDCNDWDANIYPGAPDPPGDGADSDCFGGDGLPEVADLGDGRYGPVPAGLDKPNFLLVTVDALRPDHLGCAGYPRRTPHLDRLCETSVRFDDVTAQSSRSIRSIPSMFTGLYPSQITFGDEFVWVSLDPSNDLLAEILRDHGYTTAVAMGTNYFDRSRDFFQGFQRVVTDPEYIPPRGRVIDDGLALIDEAEAAEAPWFVWIHLFNVHQPYLQDGIASHFGDEPVDYYDTEVQLADAQVGRLLAALEERGLDEETVIVLASDHGEAFDEHGSSGHSTTLYEEEIRATLMVRVPGVAPRVVESPVALMDLTPTLLNLAGVPVPRPMPARSLVPLFQGDVPEANARLLISELMPDGHFPFDRKTLRRGPWKLHWWTREGRIELYDLANDPRERHDRSDDREDVASELLGLLRAWTASTALPRNQHSVAVAEHRLERAPRRMTRRLDLGFQELFTVLGYDLPRRSYAPGDVLPLNLYYEVLSATDRNFYFMVSANVQPGHRDVPHMHVHHYPINGRYFTTMWQPGEILRDPCMLTLPEELEPGSVLRLTLAIRDQDRLIPFDNGETIVELGEVTIGED